MDKVEEARQLLQKIGMPEKQQADLCCYVLLAMSNIKENDDWKVATNEWIRIHDIIQFVGANYGVTYAENSRETFRKQALHHFRTAALIEDNGKTTNSPNYRYRLTDETLEMIRSIGGHKADSVIKRFITYHEKLIEIYASKKEMTKMPVKINNQEFTFSAGKHNELQKAIVEEFAPRFALNSECLYVGDTIEKDLVKNVAVFKMFSDSLAWETEVWISEMPDHMIHLNGDRFMRPRG
ncbi:MAG: BsuBI/PstI family type II restriction endonuclease [Lachnospiraceae bacterium]